MTQAVIVNDVGTLRVVNALLILLIVSVAAALIFRYSRRTFQTLYREPGQCAPDDYYAYKDPNIHADC